MEEKKKSIMCVIREMEKDAKEIFPISNRTYILNLISYRLKDKEPDKKWGIKSDKDNGIVTVTRILLDNILRLFSTEIFGKDKSAYYVGGEKKLISLIEAGKIESDKPANVQNGKWHCNAAQVLLHCRCAKKVKRKKRKK